LAPVTFNTLCFRYLSPQDADLDRVNQTLLQSLNASGEMFMTHTRLKGVYVLRWVLGQTRLEQRHIAAAWEKIQATARAL
jgi:aromatic-L-amino-acid decarboxylase